MLMFDKLGQQRGVTLLESIVVLLLISLLITMIFPLIQQTYTQFELDVAIVRLHKDIRWAQRLAVREQKQVSILFFRDTKPISYVIKVQGSNVYYRRGSLPANLSGLTASTIFINPDRTFQKSSHIMIQKGEVRRYVYYYQTGRSRVTSVPA